ncbi:hypothetical protein [Streptomyces sp. C1-2]|uniref:hypothetical protein n=1 Tax=Streptomyces sp. C1-2 TaxID=2720022 RepID=UPI001F0E9FBF|nr:hypothetical protein [Streptomyces sp. C1-2]
MRAQRLQQQPALRQRRVLDRGGGEVGLAGGGGEAPLVARGVREGEAAGVGHPGVEVLEAGDDAGDPVTDGGVVPLELLPGHPAVRAEHPPRQPAHDGGLGQQVGAGGLQAAPGGVHHAHGVLHGHELLPARLHVPLGAAEGGQDQRPGAGDRVGAVEFRRHVHREPGAAHRGLGDLRVGGGGDEVAAHREEHLRLAVAQGPYGPDDVVAVGAGRREAELLLQRVQEGGGGPLEDAHGAVALHVGVAAHRAHARAGTADVAAQQQEVDDLADRGHRVLVLGQAHRPAHDDALGVEHHPQGALDVLAGQAGRGEGLLPVGGAGRLGELLVAVRVRVDELLVDRALRLEDQPVEETEQRLVAAEPDLQEQIGEGGALEQAPRGLGVLEALQARLGQWVDADDARAARLRLLQRGEHPRVVGARVLPGHDDQVRLVQVLQQDAALADADRLRQGRTGGLVAHVGAVGQVVGAQLAGEELVEERRLVAGAARGVEDRLVGGGERAQFLGDDVEGAVPADRLVVVGALRQVHGVGEPALLAQPVTAAAGEVGDRVRAEELRGDPAQGGLLRDRLGAVLAELGGVPLLALGPGAAGAVEPVLLVDAQQGQRGAPHSHLLLGHDEAVPDGRETGRHMLGAGDPGGVLHRICLRRLRRHRTLSLAPWV